MADTSALQAAIEWVRSDLARRHGFAFDKRTVQLRTGGSRPSTRSQNASTSCLHHQQSGMTSGETKPVGRFRGGIAELYLSLVDAPERLIVTTDAAFNQLLTDELAGAIADDIRIMEVNLPSDPADAVARVNRLTPARHDADTGTREPRPSALAGTPSADAYGDADRCGLRSPPRQRSV